MSLCPPKTVLLPLLLAPLISAGFLSPASQSAKFRLLSSSTLSGNRFSPAAYRGGKAQGVKYASRSISRTLKAVADGDSSLKPGSTVLVVGGTGGVGQLVTKKLAARGTYSVRVASRDEERAREVIDDNSIEVAELDLVRDTPENEQRLADAVNGADAVVIATGTTAFPTTKWMDGNTPHAVDELAVTRLATAAARSGSVKRVVFVTSIGVERRKEMPFSVLNLFGVLDAKRNGEVAIISEAAEGDFDYAIVRPGRLVGGPYTNLDVAKLLQIEGGAENGVTVEAGDTLLGDCKRDACAEAVVQCLENPACKDLEFAVVSNEEKALTTEQWTEVFNKMTREMVAV